MPNDLTVEQMIEQLRGEIASRPAPPPPEIKIPNAYKKLHPLDRDQAVTKEDLRPAGVELDTTIRFILRSGLQGKAKGGRLWWGDNPHCEDAIVGYRIIKLENPWVEWGIKFDRGEELETSLGGVPLALAETNPIVKIWLRDYPIPQEDTRRARSWDWMVSGESGGDIMKYRLVLDDEDD
jgi:hypothetical protein